MEAATATQASAAETVECRACGAKEARIWRRATPSDPAVAASASYLLRRCAACGSAMLEIEETSGESPALYEAGSYSPARSGVDGVIEVTRRVADRDRLRFVDGVRAGGRVFEIGAGDGRFLAALARRGFSVAGIEPSPTYAAAAQQRGVDVEQKALEEVELPKSSQDAVLLWHVLEHVDDPCAALGRIRNWLAPEGRVVVAVPNLASLQARIGGDRWFHQDVPRHVTHFTVEGVSALFARCGYRVVRVRHVLVEQNPLGMWQTVLNRLTREPNVLFRLVKRNLDYERRADKVRDLAVTFTAGPLLAIPAAALELGAGAARRGGTIVVEAAPAHDDAPTRA